MTGKRLLFVLALAWLAAVALGALSAPSWGDPLRVNLQARLAPPSWAHLLGTDELGRELIVRLCHAARLTLVVTLGATGLSLSLGFILGCLGGWFGGPLDWTVTGLINLFWTVPFVVFAVSLVAIVGANASTLILAIGMINWVTSARVFRTETRRVRRSDFLVSARAAGFGPLELFVFHLLPNLRAAWLTLAGYGAAETTTLEAGLAFLGLSLPPPSPTWGGMIADGLQYFSSAWWVAGIPALAVTVTLASFRAIADALGQGRKYEQQY